MDRKNLNVGGEWLGAVPKLAICKNLDEPGYALSHCTKEWNELCSVEVRDSIDEVMSVAEKHYSGITTKWIDTSYDELEARKIIDEEILKNLCSFCGANPFGRTDGLTMIGGKGVNICSECIKSFSAELGRERL